MHGLTFITSYLTRIDRRTEENSDEERNSEKFEEFEEKETIDELFRAGRSGGGKKLRVWKCVCR